MKDARRSLSFDVSTSLEDQDTAKDIEEYAQMSVDRMSAEAQLRSDCETLWQELNSVSSVSSFAVVCDICLFYMTVLYFYSE